jgi:hypothetical protein
LLIDLLPVTARSTMNSGTVEIFAAEGADFATSQDAATPKKPVAKKARAEKRVYCFFIGCSIS